MNQPRRLQYFSSSYIVCTILMLVSLGTVTYTVYRYWQSKKAITAAIYTNADNELSSANHSFESDIHAIEKQLNNIALQLSTQQTNSAIDTLLNDVFSNPLISGAGVFYAAPEQSLTSYYLFRNHGKPERIYIEKFYNYRDATWFKEIINHNELSWIEPFLEVSTNQVHIRCGMPLFHFDTATQSNTAIGVVVIDLSLQSIAIMMENLTLKHPTYSFLISNNGTLLFHPNALYAEQMKTIFDLAQLSGEKEWRLVGNAALRKETGVIRFQNKMLNTDYLIFYEPVTHTGWSIVLVYNTEVEFNVSEVVRKNIINVALATCIFIILLLTLLLGVPHDYDSIEKYWIIVGVWSVLATFLVVFIWFFDTRSSHMIEKNETIITDKAELQRFLAVNNKTNQKLQKDNAIYIPTSIFLENISIKNYDEITVQGYIWQKYPLNLSKDISRDFVLTNALSTTINNSYHVANEKHETYGWQFNAVIRGNFNYSKYPLDIQNPHISIVHKDKDKNVVLIPDLDSWDLLAARFHIGLTQKLLLPGWSINRAYFSYSTSSLDTNFGIQHFVGKEFFPILRYNLIIQRTIISPLLGGLLPIIIILILMFALLLVAGTRMEQVNLGDILSIAAEIYFSVIISYTQFKTGIPDQASITYFEYFYFFIYIFILINVINVLVLKLTKRFGWIYYRQNIAAKLLYWPIALSSLLIITLITFY